MVRRALWLISALAVSIVSAAGQTADELVVMGQALATERCARCHATGAIDVSPHAKAPPFRDVVTRYPSEHLAEALAEGIVSGHPDMPVYVMTTAEIDAFLAFIDSLAPATPPKSGAKSGAEPKQR